MTDDTTWRIRSVECPKCGAKVGEDCFTPSGRTARRSHTQRVALGTEPIRTKTGKVLTDDDIQALADEAEQGYDVSHLKIRYTKLPKKLKHVVRAKEYVWCDSHGAVHPRSTDYYDEGSVYCAPDNWRRVYVESDDKNEPF